MIVEPDWNPSQDLQAQDRAYRIGQTQHTSVYRLVSAGSVEETIYDRQVYKHQLSAIALDGQCSRRYFDGVAGMKGQEGELWGMANLFRFNPSDSVMTDREDFSLSPSLFHFPCSRFSAGRSAQQRSSSGLPRPKRRWRSSLQTRMGTELC